MDDSQAMAKLLLLYSYLGFFTLFSINQCLCLDYYHPHCLPSQETALIKFKEGLIDPSNRLESWQLGSDCCSWRGITCDNQTGYVIAMDLHNPQNPYANLPFDEHRKGWLASLDVSLGGKLGTSLMDLKKLQFLDLRLNSFEGIRIPEFIGSLVELKHLDLSYAGFHGRIPPNFGNLSKLEHLDVSSLVHTNATTSSTVVQILNGARSSSPSCDNLQWMTSLFSLKVIQMNAVNLSELGYEPMHVFSSLPSLEKLGLSLCSLSASNHITFSNFTSLQFLDFSSNFFVSEFPRWVVNITSMQYLDLSYNFFMGEFMYGLSDLPSLQVMYMVHNLVKVNCTRLFAGKWSKIAYLDIDYTDFSGSIPSSIGNITSLKRLSVMSFEKMRNGLDGNIPQQIGKLQKLEFLSLRYNKFVGKFPPKIINPHSLRYLRLDGVELQSSVNLHWFCPFKFLVALWLSNCHLTGPIPICLTEMPFLTTLALDRNHLNGTIPVELGKRSQLETLDLSHNSFQGIVHDTHFQNLNRLSVLYLSHNAIVFKPSSTWSPPRNLLIVALASSQIGPICSSWLKQLEHVSYLDLSRNEVKGSLPQWFWEIEPVLIHLNLSHNRILGHLPNPFMLFQSDQGLLDLSFNEFSGPVPCFSDGILHVDVSYNQITGQLPDNIHSSTKSFKTFLASNNEISGLIPVVFGKMDRLETLDLSTNKLNGTVPQNLVGSPRLRALDLSGNNLSGEMQWNMPKGSALRSLHLAENAISGEFPAWLENCTHLEVLVLSQNKFSGKIPQWIGESSASLKILDLRSNRFTGQIPWQLCYLSSLQVLNVADNYLNGSIPKSFGNFKAMKEKHAFAEWFPMNDGYYKDKLTMTVSGKEDEYSTILFLVNCMDLSNNNFSGEMPQELTKLSELLVLNLSHNQLGENIPGQIGEMKQLLTLDFSHNHLSGMLPQGLAALTFLSHLNLSYNNFSGEIPSGFQLQTLDDPSIYIGNSDLCGFPLKKNCSNSISWHSPNSLGWSWKDNQDYEGPLDMFMVHILAFSKFIGWLGIGAGFGAICGMLVLKTTWRIAFFRFFDERKDQMFVVFVIKLPQMWKRIWRHWIH